MIRFRSSLLTGLIAAAVLAGGVAPAHAAGADESGWADQARRGYGEGRSTDRDDDRPQSGRPSRDRDQGQGGPSSARRQISQSEAQSRAQRQARGARFVGSQGLQGSSYVFMFERDGRTFTISVSAYD